MAWRYPARHVVCFLAILLMMNSGDTAGPEDEPHQPDSRQIKHGLHAGLSSNRYQLSCQL